MKKYTTEPIDFTGCHPVIAEHLKRGEAIKCWVWDIGGKKRGDQQRWIIGYAQGIGYTTLNFVEWDYAEPIPLKVKRIMPPERAIPTLIAEGWSFTSTGSIAGPGVSVLPEMYALMGGDVDDEVNKYAWPPCIIEEVEDDE